MDEAIINYVKRKYNMLIGERTAEHIKMTVGTASPTAKTETMEIKGRDLVAGIPKVVVATSDEIREALVEPIHAIVETVHLTLEKTPPELAADIVDRGIMLVGGGSLLRELDQVLRQETKLPILRSEDPFTAVVHGAGIALDNLALLREVSLP
jgi:rod shape-determining protein MreB